MYGKSVTKQCISFITDEDAHKKTLQVASITSSMGCEILQAGALMGAKFYFDKDVQQSPQLRQVMIREFFGEYQRIYDGL